LQALEWKDEKKRFALLRFDLLQLDGKSLLGLPLEQRKQILAQVCENAATRSAIPAKSAAM